MTAVASPSPMVDEDRLEALLAELTALPPDSADRLPLRRHAIELALPLGDRLAARYYNCGEPDDDLRQVAAMGVVKAVDGYRPGAGRGFIPYAVPTVLGTLRRHFRDHTWSVRPPRKVLELRQRMANAEEQLSQRLHRPPTPAELAAQLGLDEAEVHGLRQAAHFCRPASLEAMGASKEPQPSLKDAFDTTEDLLALNAALPRLPERLRQVVRLRFWEEKTQTEIAQAVGVSQVHVSRLLFRAFDILRDYVTAAEPDPARRRQLRLRS